jgi:hypothetical protein
METDIQDFQASYCTFEPMTTWKLLERKRMELQNCRQFFSYKEKNCSIGVGVPVLEGGLKPL